MALPYTNFTHLIPKNYLKNMQLLPTKLQIENGWITVHFFLLKILLCQFLIQTISLKLFLVITTYMRTKYYIVVNQTKFFTYERKSTIINGPCTNKIYSCCTLVKNIIVIFTHNLYS